MISLNERARNGIGRMPAPLNVLCMATAGMLLVLFLGACCMPREPPAYELMEPVTSLIEEAEDLSIEGKARNAVAKLRQALAELDRVEREHPNYMRSANFAAALRSKRAYVKAAIDSMTCSLERKDTRGVAIDGTTAFGEMLPDNRSAVADSILADRQKELRQLRDSGVISEDEYSRETKRLQTRVSGSGDPRVASPAVNLVAYVVRSGDTLAVIAYSHGMTIRELRELNHLDSDRLRVGQKLVVKGVK